MVKRWKRVFFTMLLQIFLGMSTVHEAITARQCGLNVIAFSLITNVCILNDESGVEANVDEVMDTAEMRKEDLKRLVAKTIEEISNEDEEDDTDVSH